MLAKSHLSQYHDDVSISRYLDEQAVLQYKELSLPRFQVVKALGGGVQLTEKFVPFIRERDPMNRLINQPMLKKLFKIIAPCKAEPNPVIVQQAKSSSRIDTSIDNSHWYFNSNIVLPEVQSKNKIHSTFTYVAPPKKNKKTQSPVMDNSRRESRRGNIKKVQTDRPSVKLTKQVKYIEQVPKKKTQQSPLTQKILQPYLEKTIKSTRRDLYLDSEFKPNNDIHEQMVFQKYHLKELREKWSNWGVGQNQRQRQDLQDCAQYLLESKSQ